MWMLRRRRKCLKSLKLFKNKIDQLIKEEDYAAVAKIREEYRYMMKKADENLEGLRQYKDKSQQSIDNAFENILSFTLGEVDEELSKIVNNYVQIEKLHLEGDTARSKDDKIHEMFGVERTFKHKKEVTCILSLKNGMIVSGWLDTNIRIWDPKTGKWVRVLDGHTHAVLWVIELESGFLASGSLDQTAIIWNPNTGKIVNMLEGFQNPIIGMFEFDNKHLVINFNEPILLIWAWNSSSKSKANSNTYSVGKSALTCVIKHSDDNILAGWEDGKIYRLQPSRSEKPVMEYAKHTDVVFAMEVISANKFVSNSTDFKLILWDINSGEVLKMIEVAEDMVMQMFYTKDQGFVDKVHEVWGWSRGGQMWSGDLAYKGVCAHGFGIYVKYL